MQKGVRRGGVAQQRPNSDGAQSLRLEQAGQFKGLRDRFAELVCEQHVARIDCEHLGKRGCRSSDVIDHAEHSGDIKCLGLSGSCPGRDDGASEAVFVLIAG